MAKQDYYKGLNSHFDEQDRREMKAMKSSHGAASIHPMNAYKHNHEPLDKPTTCIKARMKAKRFKVVKK